ncbi:MAG: hypothetical protein ACKVT0_17340 [Planctomycetaceae bacterium]
MAITSCELAQPEEIHRKDLFNSPSNNGELYAQFFIEEHEMDARMLNQHEQTVKLNLRKGREYRQIFAWRRDLFFDVNAGRGLACMDGE